MLFGSLTFLFAPSLLCFISPLFLGLTLLLVVLSSLFRLPALLGLFLLATLAGCIAVGVFLSPLLLGLTSLLLGLAQLFLPRPVLIVLVLLDIAFSPVPALRTGKAGGRQCSRADSQANGQAPDVARFHDLTSALLD
ncbi:MAG TPA: hypothetical protein VJT71_01160 [Pyrinomonadaceae bacterium]|nr:hypothetical protein [Pyrinomonadaceae bacterium]